MSEWTTTCTNRPDWLAEARESAAAPGLCLVILWSAAEPWRAGEVAFVETRGHAVILGRGSASPGDTAERVHFFRQRPGALQPTPPLVGEGISRRQCHLRRAGERIEFERIGRCVMTHNGTPAEKGALAAGELLFVKDQLLLLCCERPTALQHRYFPLQQSGAFGGPDRFGIVGESPAAWELREQLAFCAASDRHVLVLGESGTGKELAVRALHQLSSRNHRPLVARNAATFPTTLIDAELFGTAPNFPNAGMPARLGVIGEAHESTLLLDEIGEMPAELQAHLLRVLDRGGEYQRLGESQMRRSAIRLVAATNRDPTELRLDLLARFQLQIQMPSLRDRLEDIPLVLRHLLKQATHQRPELVEQYFMSTPEGPEPRIDPELVQALVRYPFMANIRELEQFMWKALAQSTGKFVVLARELRGGPLTPAETPTPHAERLAVRELTADDIRRSLDAQGHNVASAAQALGLPSRYALYRLMRKFGIAVEPAPKADVDALDH